MSAPLSVTVYGGELFARGHVCHHTSGIAHQGRAGGTRPGQSLKGILQAAKAAAKAVQGIP